jgi:hypothetical protein
MLAIKGIYDGKKIIPLEKFTLRKKYKVVITFVEELDDEEALRNLFAQTDAFSFWHDQKEDIYQDYLVKGHKKQ